MKKVSELTLRQKQSLYDAGLFNRACDTCRRTNRLMCVHCCGFSDYDPVTVEFLEEKKQRMIKDYDHLKEELTKFYRAMEEL